MTAAAPSPSPTAPRDPLASLPRQDRHKPKCGPVKKSTVGKKRALVLLLVYVLMGVHVVQWWMTGKTLTPVEPSEAMQTIEGGYINAGFVLFLGLIVSTLIFGRWFCGWACHVVALQDLSAWLLGKLGLRPRPVRSRLLVLAPWLVAGEMFAWPFLQKWFGNRVLPAVDSWQWRLQTDSLWRTFPGPLMTILSIVVVGFLIVWWLGAKGFCTYGCPYGAFFAIADRVAPVRIKVTDACDACGHCTSVCTSNVRVHEEVAKHKKIVDPGCMKCLDCVSVCPKEALYVGVAWPKPFAISQQRIKARADFTWPEEILLAVVAFVATQYAWRGAWFGEAVPFLLSVGLGVITAVFTLLTWRLLRRREMAFQHTVLKQGGKLTRAGWLGLIGLVAWLLLSAHTAAGQWRRDSLFAAMGKLKQDDGPVAVEALLARADSVLAWDVIEDPFVHEMRGLLLWRLGRQQEGGQELLRAFEAKGRLDIKIASLNLAMWCLPPRGDRIDVADAVVRQFLAQPQDPMADEKQRKADEKLRKMATEMLQEVELLKRQRQ